MHVRGSPVRVGWRIYVECLLPLRKLGFLSLISDPHKQRNDRYERIRWEICWCQAVSLQRHLLATQFSQIVHGRPALEVDFIVFRGKIRRALARQKMLSLPASVRFVLGTPG